MCKKECIAMILAGGQGTRLGALTKLIAKPALPFGGKYRLIDFTLSNCYNSGIDRIGVLMPLHTFELHNGIERVDYFRRRSHNVVYSLPPRPGKNICRFYKGTANAVYENLSFIELFNPDFVLVLSGDHIYKMDYRPLLAYHKDKKAVGTIAVISVSWTEAPRFGIMNVRSDGSIVEFIEKPTQPKSNLASMGIYVFTWSKLKEYLLQDEADISSEHDFGKNVIPAMLSCGESMIAYQFDGYWKDVGTIESFYTAHMDLLGDSPEFTICEEEWPVIATLSDEKAGKLISDHRGKCLYHSNCNICGKVEGSILFSGVQVGKNATVKNSIIMPDVLIGNGAYVERAIVGRRVVISGGYTLRGGIEGAQHIAVVSENTILDASSH